MSIDNGFSEQTFFDLVTLTYKPDLDILPLDLHAKIHVRMSVLSVVAVETNRQRDRQETDRQTDNVKTITPDTS